MHAFATVLFGAQRPAMPWPAVPLTQGGGGGLSNDTSLSEFTIDGNPCTDGGSINLDNDITDLQLSAPSAHELLLVITPTDGAATVDNLTGRTNLTVGDNAMTFTITAADGVTTRDYTLTLHRLTTGAAEVTSITTVADVNGSLHGKSFTLHKAADAAVTVMLNGGAKAEQALLDFGSLTGANFVTAGAGRSLSLPLRMSGGTSLFYVWFNTGTESDPGGSGTGCEVSVSPSDGASTLTTLISNALFTLFGANAALNTPTATTLSITATETGPMTSHAVDIDSGVTVTVPQSGRNAATGGDINVSIADNDDLNAIGTKVGGAMNGQGWAATSSGSPITVTDAAVGARTAAADIDTGFTITTPTSGAAPS